MIDPDSFKSVAEVSVVTAVSIVTAVGGYLARGVGRQSSNDKTCETCDKHPDIMVAVSRIPDMHDSVKALGVKLDDFLDQVWGVIRAHERKLGRLEGLAGIPGEDTREVAHEKNTRY